MWIWTGSLATAIVCLLLSLLSLSPLANLLPVVGAGLAGLLLFATGDRAMPVIAGANEAAVARGTEAVEQSAQMVAGLSRWQEYLGLGCIGLALLQMVAGGLPLL